MSGEYEERRRMRKVSGVGGLMRTVNRDGGRKYSQRGVGVEGSGRKRLRG